MAHFLPTLCLFKPQAAHVGVHILPFHIMCKDSPLKGWKVRKERRGRRKSPQPHLNSLCSFQTGRPEVQPLIYNHRL